VRSDDKINSEIRALRKALKLKGRWNDAARKTIEETIKVLDERMTAEQIERTYYCDETDVDYQEGDNDLYNALMLVHYWMMGDSLYDAPSNSL
jgi:hypothetical protein